MKRISFLGMVIAVGLLLASMLSSCSSDPVRSENISQNSGQSLAARIVADSEGSLHVIWHDDTEKPNAVLYASKSPDSGWSQPVNVSGTGMYARKPSLAIDGEDTLHVVWYGSPLFGEGADIFYASKPRGDDWSKPLGITLGAQVSEQTSLAVGLDDTLHLVYNADTGAGPDIFHASRPKGEDWSTPVNITTDESKSMELSLAADKTGRLHLAWSAEHEGNWEIIYKSIGPDGELSLPTNVSNNQGESRSPSVTVDSQNNVHLVWHDDTASKGTWDLLYISLTPEGAWQPLVNITEDTNGTAGFPQLAADSTGRLHLVFNYLWPSLKRSYDILYNIKPVGGNWGRATDVSHNDSQSGDPSIAVNPKGGVCIAYSDDAPGNWDIFVAHTKD